MNNILLEDAGPFQWWEKRFTKTMPKIQQNITLSPTARRLVADALRRARVLAGVSQTYEVTKQLATVTAEAVDIALVLITPPRRKSHGA